jgi:2-polyprenyl-3-methyl-5-hydroxy-6-metoxy-1,4-benzoquinol methylase
MNQTMDLGQYRASETEKQRTRDLMRHIQGLAGSGKLALDIGARDGHFSRLLAEHFESVVALDLETPSIQHRHVLCVQGDVTALEYPDDAFDFVFCAEVLEHLPGRAGCT